MVATMEPVALIDRPQSSYNALLFLVLNFLFVCSVAANYFTIIGVLLALIPMIALIGWYFWNLQKTSLYRPSYLSASALLPIMLCADLIAFVLLVLPGYLGSSFYANLLAALLAPFQNVQGIIMCVASIFLICFGVMGKNRLLRAFGFAGFAWSYVMGAWSIDPFTTSIVSPGAVFLMLALVLGAVWYACARLSVIGFEEGATVPSRLLVIELLTVLIVSVIMALDPAGYGAVLSSSLTDTFLLQPSSVAFPLWKLAVSVIALMVAAILFSARTEGFSLVNMDSSVLVVIASALVLYKVVATHYFTFCWVIPLAYVLFAVHVLEMYYGSKGSDESWLHLIVSAIGIYGEIAYFSLLTVLLSIASVAFAAGYIVATALAAVVCFATLHMWSAGGTGGKSEEEADWADDCKFWLVMSLGIVGVAIAVQSVSHLAWQGVLITIIVGVVCLLGLFAMCHRDPSNRLAPAGFKVGLCALLAITCLAAAAPSIDVAVEQDDSKVVFQVLSDNFEEGSVTKYKFQGDGVTTKAITSKETRSVNDGELVVFTFVDSKGFSRSYWSWCAPWASAGAE